ncbi:MAG: hypothetical protein RLY14_159 [Planctomycetota bacterium]|jgi:hypothetical protein
MKQFQGVCFLFLVLAGFFLGVGTNHSVAIAQGGDPVPNEPEYRWWKGNLHTHSFWSDGNDFPEMISEWYRVQGYNFLAMSDHNRLAEGMRWMKEAEILKRGGPDVLKKYRNRFGGGWVETQGKEDTKDYEIRLKPLDEYRSLVEERGRFIVIPAEEITDSADGKPVHMNATNVAEAIKPVGGSTVREAMQNNLRLVLEQEKKLGREILPHLNHPNFGYAITADDLAAVIAERFFEVYNGHPGVNHLGDKDHIGVEKMWDAANYLRVMKMEAPLLYGVATDDSHEYHGKPGSHPGRGWVMVKSRYLTPEHLIKAMKEGDFYSSSGVTLRDVNFSKKKKTLTVEINPDPNATYKTEYIVSKKSDDASNVGIVVSTSEELSSRYELKEDDLYVRAVVTSSLAPLDPVWKEQKQQAWTQPFSAK